ncbi:MAG: nuclear transport factor 2 family protein [Actinomycetota bacterium]|nr:nuclear transport factor 2 family protein [Actinomycetota bacterium]
MAHDRLGPWQPTTVEERLDRMESYAAIQQLVSRYARALDARDMDTVVDMFNPHVQVGATGTGREALKEWMSGLMSQMRTSVHLVANHVIDFENADHATGVVYCRDELERPDTGEWAVGTLQYWDDYDRVDGQWYISRRRIHRWYLVDWLERPEPGAGVNDFGATIRERLLPDAYPSWQAFWDTRGG